MGLQEENTGQFVYECQEYNSGNAVIQSCLVEGVNLMARNEQNTVLDELLRKLEEAEKEFDEKMKNADLEHLLAAQDSKHS